VPFGIAGLALVLYAIFHPTAREARRAAFEASVEQAAAAADAAADVVVLDPELVLLEDHDDLEEPQPPRAQHA